MDFDHVWGEKKFNLSSAATGRHKIRIIEEEIAKCDIVCANCHRVRTFTRSTVVQSATRLVLTQETPGSIPGGGTA